MFSKKEGQVSFFMVVGIVVMLISIILVLNTYNFEKEPVLNPIGFEGVVTYTSDFFESAADEALWELSYGGYIHEDFPVGKWYTSYHGWKVPYYLIEEFQLPFDEISLKENIKLKMVEKINSNLTYSFFEEKGYKVEHRNISVDDILVKINQEDVSFVLNYPIEIRFDDKYMNKEEFLVKEGIPIGRIHNIVKEIVTDIKSSEVYDMSKYCEKYDKDGATNLYVRKSDKGEFEIIQIITYSAQDKRLKIPYRFNIAIYNRELKGVCKV